VLKQDRQLLESQGILPGSWDLSLLECGATCFNLLQYRLNFAVRSVVAPGTLNTLRVLDYSGPATNFSFDADVEPNVQNIGTGALGSAPAGFELSVPQGGDFRLVAASQPGGPFDIYFSLGTGNRQPLLSGLTDTGFYTGEIIQVSAAGVATVIGTFNVGEDDTPPPQVDTDNDTIFDQNDNCTLIANTDQRDTDGDGFGNRCDGDLNNDNIVNVTDQNLLKARFMTSDPHADLNGDGTVNSLDLGLFKNLYLKPPGPRGALP
jgi:hypothetical protein